MYGHPFGPRLLQVEDARTYHHAGALPFSGEKRSGRAGTCCLRVTGWAVGSACRSRGLGRLVAGLLRLLHVLREIDVLGLRSPHRPDDDQDGAYDQEGERSVLEGHDLLQASLVVGIERREDDRQTVAKPETRSTNAGVEALVYVGGRKAPGPDDQGYDHGGEEDDQQEALWCGTYEQVVKERAHDCHDETSEYKEGHDGQLDVENVDEEPNESSPYGVLCPWVHLLLPPSACRVAMYFLLLEIPPTEI